MAESTKKTADPPEPHAPEPHAHRDRSIASEGPNKLLKQQSAANHDPEDARIKVDDMFAPDREGPGSGS